MNKENQPAKTGKKLFKDLYFTQKIKRISDELALFSHKSRSQYRLDVKAVLCRGISDPEVKLVKRGLLVEDISWYISRAYVPMALFYGYKVGYFTEEFSRYEFRRIAKYAIHMWMIGLVGHAFMKYSTY